MTKILMVCLGNICRSPLAHGILESKLPSDKFEIDSAGTGDYHIGKLPDHRSIATAKANGIDISSQRCRQFQQSDFDVYDIIYVMDHSNYDNVVTLARDADDVSKVKLILEDVASADSLEVPDPYWGGAEDFNKVYALLDYACDKIAVKLTQ
ncbi:low molecular weight protein-tyrosine-phosphatase [Gelidibacter salicanalis]|uniref:protein-tyrosine-phosphatase n=1 Tax=Gelidibacter salicanalis TaxID=291193 RepID=A0A934NIX1_9FLAO|nr:low molecular weight protein-tyrosine-phosphatase [Gelidibacter salicanalis]MBJ7881713.1 low molecular weight phosphotyrosine protein phosphatase [Gelidibacter salicanalis]